jgi:hypothetical protein
MLMLLCCTDSAVRACVCCVVLCVCVCVVCCVCCGVCVLCAGGWPWRFVPAVLPFGQALSLPLPSGVGVARAGNYLGACALPHPILETFRRRDEGLLEVGRNAKPSMQ